MNVGDDVLISHIHGYIANYDIGPRAYICDVGRIYMDGVSSFGIGVRVNVLQETGGRELAIYEGLSAQAAYLSAMYRHRPELTEHLNRMADSMAKAVASDRGMIGSGARNRKCRNHQECADWGLCNCTGMPSPLRWHSGQFSGCTGTFGQRSGVL